VNRVVSVLLGLVFATSTLQLSASAQQPDNATQQPKPQETTTTKLTNKDVADLYKAGLTPQVIVAKIKSSPTDFDTSPTALQEMKTAGISDEVILAMVQASTGSIAPMTATPGALVEVKVPDGTQIEVELVNNVSGQEAKIGDIVDFKIISPVQINGVTVFEKGASARARITAAKKAGHWGHAGKLEWAMQDVQALDGNRIPARFTQHAVGDSKGGTVAVAAAATTVLLGPVGLLWGLKKGKPAIIPAGNRYSIFVHGDTTIKGKPGAVATGS